MSIKPGCTFSLHQTWKKVTFALAHLSLSSPSPSLDHIFRIPAYAEDQPSHLTSQTDPQTFHGQTAIVGLAGPQPVSHSDKSPLCGIHSISSAPLENPA